MISWVDNEDMCKNWKKKWIERKKASNLFLNIEIEKQDEQSDNEEILNVFSFKNILDLAEIEKLEVTEDSLNTLMKKCDIQYNREKQIEEEKASL